MDVRIFTEEERFGSWVTKRGVEKTGQKWSVHLDGLGRQGGFRTQIPDLPLSTCRRLSRLFILPEPLFAPTSDVKAHTSKGRYKE